MRQQLAVAIERPMDVLASVGVLYSALLMAWIPDDPWKAAVAWSGAVAWAMCATAFALAGQDLALRWAAFSGLMAGGFTELPLGDPSPAALFRAFLPLALRRALGLRTPGWAVAALLGFACALPLAPEWSTAAVLVAMLGTAVELAITRWPWRWSQPLAVCIALPAALAAAEIFGVARFDVGTVVFTVGAVAVLMHASFSGARTAL
jgi:hypothetical protein